MSDSASRTLELFQMGRTPATIAERRQLSLTTIYRHLEEAILTSRLELSEVLPEEIRAEVRRAYNSVAAPTDSQKVAGQMLKRIPLAELEFALRALGLRLGNARRILPHERKWAAEQLLRALKSPVLDHTPYTLVRLLQGAWKPRREERTLFGLFHSYDRDCLLELVSYLVKFERLSLREPVEFERRSQGLSDEVLQLQERDPQGHKAGGYRVRHFD